MCSLGSLAIALTFALGSSVLAQTTLTPFQEQKARQLLREQLPCLGCHELDGAGGRSAPSLTTVGQRRSAAYIRAIVEDPGRVVIAAAMPRVSIPASTRELVIRFLARNAPAGGPPGASGAAATSPATPAELYAKWCSTCHGVHGQGDGVNAAHLPVKPAVHANASHMARRSDDALFDAIAAGGAAMGRSARMPAFGASLTSSQIRSLVAYIRQLCRCQAPAWSTDGEPR